MFCFQCQEAANGTGCTIQGVCGKKETTANLQDLLIYDLKGIAVLAKGFKAAGVAVNNGTGLFLAQGLFTTITNAMLCRLDARRNLTAVFCGGGDLSDATNWTYQFSREVGNSLSCCSSKPVV
jgi:hydroxylamine reductase (hybrid-cluster protein)